MKFVMESVVPASVEAVFAFHERPDAFEVLQPPWEKMRIVQPPRSLETGTLVVVQIRVGLLWLTIESEHVAYEKNRRFVDEMRRGPFAKFRHEHLFFEDPRGCRMRDEIDYEPPLGWLGRVAAPLVIAPRFRRMFEYRHEVMRREVLA